MTTDSIEYSTVRPSVNTRNARNAQTLEREHAWQREFARLIGRGHLVGTMQEYMAHEGLTDERLQEYAAEGFAVEVYHCRCGGCPGYWQYRLVARE
jgi:hypothetical protein